MLDVVTFKWKPRPGYRSKHTGEHVNIMRNMVARNYTDPHRFTCITDDPTGIDPAVRIIPLEGAWNEFADVVSPHGPENPSCYRRLSLFAPWVADVVGSRILSIDLDMVLVGDCRPLWNRPEDVVFWQDNLNPHNRINGAMQLIRAGSRPKVYDCFNPMTSPSYARAKGHWGSDQAWLSFILGDNEAKWTTADGAYSWRVHCRSGATPAHMPYDWRNCTARLPDGARVINMHGCDDPWTVAPRVQWMAENYR